MSNRNLLFFRRCICLNWLMLVFLAEFLKLLPAESRCTCVHNTAGTDSAGFKRDSETFMNAPELSRVCAPGMFEKPVCCLCYCLKEPPVFLSWVVIRSSFPGCSLQALGYLCCRSDICQSLLLQPFLGQVCLTW